MPTLTDAIKGVKATEQLNIEGKRSGDGFVTHKARLVDALMRATGERVTLADCTIGRKGLLGYIKALAGSNMVKIVPAGGGDSVPHTTVKRLKVVCGSHTSYLDNEAWIGEKTPFTQAELRVSPRNTILPNMGNLELAEALSQVLPFTAKEDNRPVLQCVSFEAKDGKLNIVTADGFRLAVVTLDYNGDDGQVLVNAEDLRGIVNALARAKRVYIALVKAEDTLDTMNLIIDTEVVKYKFMGASGTFPDYKKLIPTEVKYQARFDSIEAIKAIASLKVLANAKTYALDLTIGNGKLIISNTDDKGQVEIPADTEGEGKVRLDGSYLRDALRACQGMIDLRLVSASSPILFTVDGYQLVTMPMFTAETPKAEAKAEVKAEDTTRVVAEAEAIAEAIAQAEGETSETTEPAETEAEAKPKRSRKKDKVAVA